MQTIVTSATWTPIWCYTKKQCLYNNELKENTYWSVCDCYITFCYNLVVSMRPPVLRSISFVDDLAYGKQLGCV